MHTWNGLAWRLTKLLCDFVALTFKSRASYIQDVHTATLQMLNFIYIFFKKYKY
jgi:hypothetical protein